MRRGNGHPRRSQTVKWVVITGCLVSTVVLLNHTAEGAQHAVTANHSTTLTLLVAIDISKHRHEVLIGIPGKKRGCRLTITNTLEDFHRLSTALASYDLPVQIGFEATGTYHRPLAHHLGQAGFELKLVSSVGLARTREALHNSWDKNDP